MLIPNSKKPCICSRLATMHFGPSQSSLLCLLPCRQANAHLIAPSQSLEIGVPSYCESDHNYGNNYYIASLSPVDPQNDHHGPRSASAHAQATDQPVLMSESASRSESQSRSQPGSSSQQSCPESSLHTEAPGSSTDETPELLMQQQMLADGPHGPSQSQAGISLTAPGMSCISHRLTYHTERLRIGLLENI